jgi:hypothetical protein
MEVLLYLKFPRRSENFDFLSLYRRGCFEDTSTAGQIISRDSLVGGFGVDISDKGRAPTERCCKHSNEFSITIKRMYFLD